MLGLGTTLLVLGLVANIQDLTILGAIFLGFTVMLGTCTCVFIVRPIYNARKVAQSETYGSGVESVGFSGSEEDLERISSNFAKIKVEADESDSVFSGERDAEKIIVDVKSRLGSAASGVRNSNMTPDRESRKISFML